MIIEPQDRTARSNLAEHDQMIDGINANDALANEAKAESTEALTKATSADTKADTAQQTAYSALTKATTADGKADTNATAITAINGDITTLNGLMDFITANAFISVSFNKSATAVTAVFRRKDGTTYSANLPIATTTTAGFMDSAMKQQLDANTNSIVVLQSQYPTIFVTFPSASPTQAEIQTVYDNYSTAYPAINLPSIPAQGFTMIDTTNNITVAYDKVAVKWVFSTNAISKATNSTYGVLVGEENGADGSLYIVAGKALVNGFDALKGRMDDVESAIAIRVSNDTFNAHVGSTALHKTTVENTKLEALPLITSGDAGKVLTVKQDETGYENTAIINNVTGNTFTNFAGLLNVLQNAKLGDVIAGVLKNSEGSLGFVLIKHSSVEALGMWQKLWDDDFYGSTAQFTTSTITFMDVVGVAHNYSSAATYCMGGYNKH